MLFEQGICVIKGLLVGLWIIFLAGGVILPAYAEKPYWIKMDDQTAIREGYDSEYDRNSIRYDSSTGRGTLWTRQLYHPGSEGYRRRFYSLEFQYEIDCQSRTIRGGPIYAEYLDLEGEGEDLDDEWQDDWAPIRPTSIAQTWYESVCP